MWLIHAAMRRPVTVVMLILGIVLASALAITRMKADIFPDLGTPVIYVAQPYGGMDPAQMEGYLVNYYEYHFLYIRGIDHVESRSIQGAALMKLHFHDGTDMATAMAETVAQVNRSRSFMPPGTVPPFIMRFDAGSVPVGYLVFSSETRGVDEIADLALFRVRPMFSRLEGVSAPPPFGGSARSLVVRVDPDKLRAYRMSPDDVVRAIARTNTISPSGSVRIEDRNYLSPVNSTVVEAVELNDVPIRSGPGPTVYLRDVGHAEDAADILTSYALVDGARAVYIAATKRADASTLEVVDRVREALPTFRAAIPEDIQVTFEFDQSFYVLNAIRALTTEGVLGALLTGVVVLLLLGSLRSSIVVVTTIPIALLSSTVALWAFGQSINLMTLGGLTLAIGILVDEAIIAVENIHTHVDTGRPVARAVLEASREVAVPRLLAMLCVVSVFAPSFLMTGVARAIFVPLALAVAFSMIASYLLASTYVPIMETWLTRRKRGVAPRTRTWFTPIQAGFAVLSGRLVAWRWAVAGVYLLATAGTLYSVGGGLGTDIFPRIDTNSLQLRVRGPSGTRVERTERIAQQVLDAVGDIVGPENVEKSIAFVGVQPSSFPVNLIFLWTGGPHEAVLRIALDPDSGIPTAQVEEELRERLPRLAPGTRIAFEAPDLVSQVMSFGAPTPIEIAVSGPSLPDSESFAGEVIARLEGIGYLRDVQIGELLSYPAVKINVDRKRAAQLGVSVEEVGRALAPATWSSRFTTPVYWADPRSGIAYQVQVEIPQSRIQSLDDVSRVPVKSREPAPTLVGDVAEVSFGQVAGEYHRFNMQRMVTVTANVAGLDLGRAASDVRSALADLAVPRGISVALRGQIAPMELMTDSLELGLLLSVVAVFLLLAGYFQSLRVALVVIMAVPAVLSGVVMALALSGVTINLQSFMGAIMAIGVSMADSILLCTFAERNRLSGMSSVRAAVEASRSRMRPIVMTSAVMIAGMTPLALGAEQTAPLGIAVIGGLVASTLTALVVIPAVFAIVQRNASDQSASIDPEDPGSPHYSGGPATSAAAS